ncbi:MAG: cbb3-type cytochrome c oxidase N-terminal domain-containing protein [Thermodesulfovibrionales bacterium]
MAEDTDNITEFEAKETSHKLPIGWLVLFWGLILWGVYYFVTYSPAISGWTQEKAYQESIKK